MNKSFSNCFKVVATVHVVFVVLVLFVSTWQGCVSRKKDVVIPIVFTVEAPVDAVVSIMEQQPAVEPVPSPVAPVLKPIKKAVKKKKKVEPKKKRKKTPIKISDKVVDRKVKKTRAKPLSEKQIQKMLADGARLGEKTSIPNDEGRSLGRIHAVLYRAWVDRPSADGAEGAVLEVMFRFAGDGRILSREIIKRSGNTAMDDSVMKAVASVGSVSGLSKDFLERHRFVITVAFSLE